METPNACIHSTVVLKIVNAASWFGEVSPLHQAMPVSAAAELAALPDRVLVPATVFHQEACP
jgi:hypothetical protein